MCVCSPASPPCYETGNVLVEVWAVECLKCRLSCTLLTHTLSDKSMKTGRMKLYFIFVYERSLTLRHHCHIQPSQDPFQKHCAHQSRVHANTSKDKWNKHLVTWDATKPSTDSGTFAASYCATARLRLNHVTIKKKLHVIPTHGHRAAHWAGVLAFTNGRRYQMTLFLFNVRYSSCKERKKKDFSELCKHEWVQWNQNVA